MMEEILKGLRASAEATRLRILGLCAHAELTVSDLVEILGQSQPRISRHLKLLVEAGVLVRNQEGPWAWYRLPEEGTGGELARLIVDLLPSDDRQHAQDLKRLQSISEGWTSRVADFFRQHAGDWEQIRSLHADQAAVDAALLAALPDGPIESLLDIGTGAGHVLSLVGKRAQSAIGVDRSREMLNVARSNLFRAGLRHCQVRQADMFALPFEDASFGAITMNMVLHFADRPDAALAEAGRVLAIGGRLVIVDFVTHHREQLREEQAHRWLGFDDAQIQSWCRAAGLYPLPPQHLAGGELTVALWSAERRA
ncbi:ArsR/SmtB family transcription factor [Dongia rigui]|uniref:Metalloregulator ArsR/SmtB family transcription factor n=1 Tax=Dongia rigui TaxID=940149 RepID=A0ABU5E247_9PROT|nr:metalloregulator ArsR/SmtB family transcription factor [Dongia rigui]MDY0872973.1 metalloregulator ArsR/SmtB family transcription factor [Dongia rigui]